LGSHSSLKSDSLGLDLTATIPSAAVLGLSTGREEKINYMLELSDEDQEVRKIIVRSININMCSIEIE